MAKVPKRRRIKPGTVLIKRCIKSNTKNKTFSTLHSKYQKLKLNNHALAKALSQEKQENQLLFSRNVELIAEQQNLIYACNQRDSLIKILYRNAKNLLPMIVDMSKFTTDTIAECQTYFNSSLSAHRASSSSTSRRESAKRLSMKSPARGVVKPMVSGHTITKPVINLSRVNLSVIAEGPATPERNLNRSVENRRSRVMPERIAINDLRNEVTDPEERVIVNRRTSRFSNGRLSSGRRYSKRDSGRLSGGLAGRLSKRNSDHTEILKSPRVALQDVSRYMANNQSINVRTFSETSNSHLTNNLTTVEDTEMSESQSSPEAPPASPTIIPETQESAETSDSEAESSVNTVRRKHSSIVQSSSSKSHTMESEIIDPLEGSSWMYNTSPNNMEFTGANTNSPSSGDEPTTQAVSPVSSLVNNERRRSSACFRMPEMPKSAGKTKRNLNVGFQSMRQNSFDATTNSQSNDDDDDDEEEDDQTCSNLRRFITERRGPSTRGNSSHYNNDYDDVDDEDTLLLNIRRPIQPPPQRRQPNQQFEQPEQPESIPFDINELLELTPLKPLKNIMNKQSQMHNQVDVEPEVTATIQLTQRMGLFGEPTDTISRISTIKMPAMDQPSVIRFQESERRNSQERRFSDLTTAKINGNINLPRLTDAHDTTANNQSQLLEDSLPVTQKRKRAVARPLDYTASDTDGEVEVEKQKKMKQRKKKDKDKDPSSAKVVLQKLNDSRRNSTQSERKNSDESISSARSSGLRVDQSSDSESTASKTGRPRRQKAPKNLQEPSLSKKLRRL